MNKLFIVWYVFFVLVFFTSADSKQSQAGHELYAYHCLECHGGRGQGVEGEFSKPLVGDWSLKKLIRYVEETMPDYDPELVVGKEAEQISKFIYESFYRKPELFKNESKIKLAHLTNRQFKQSMADIFSEFEGHPQISSKENGLLAIYYDFSGKNERKKKVTERVENAINHDFEGRSPLSGMDEEKFSVHWKGSILPRETGLYEFFVRSPNGFVFRVNKPKGIATMEEKVSPGMMREVRAKIFLLGGRPYPISLDFFKFNDSKASIVLKWKTPVGEKEIIPNEFLFTQTVPASFISQVRLPPNDSSYGFERGIQVDGSWDEAVTFSALEASNYACEKITGMINSSGEEQARKKLVQVAEEFVRLAIREKPSDETMQFFVHSNFDHATPLSTSIEKVVLLSLKSPRFLYPEWQALANKNASTVVANRLALHFWDSIPNNRLNQIVDHEQLSKIWQVEEQAKRMLMDSRSKAKFNDFLIHWLEINTPELPLKNLMIHPEFSHSLLTDLRRSLLRSVESIVWEKEGTLRDLLRMPHFEYNENIASFYDLPYPRLKDESEFISMESTKFNRHGIHTHPYLLANFSYPEESSPIHRGVFVSRKILGRSLRPPREAISFSNADFDPSWSMREKVTSITKPANCMSCHDVINSTGFSLEGFDATGRTRKELGGDPINLKVNFLDDKGVRSELNGPEDLLEQAFSSSKTAEAFVYELSKYVAKQAPESYSTLEISRLSQRLYENEITLMDLYYQICVMTACDGFEFKD